MSKQDKQGARTATDLIQRYNFGKTFAEVYGLVTDAQKAAEAAEKAASDLDATLTPEEIFNRLTNYGEDQGIYRENDKIYVNANYIKSGKIDSKYIDVENLKVDAANIEGLTVQAADIKGTLTANQIKLGGAMSVFKTMTGADLGGYLGYVSGMNYDLEETSGMGMVSTDGKFQAVVTDSGARISSLDVEVLAATHGWVKSKYNIYLDADGYIYDGSGAAISSDRNAKENILYDVDEKYLPIFDKLQPCSFRYKGRSRQHLGFIAQEVEEAMLDSGVDGKDFAAVVNDEGKYSLRYTEFIPLLVAKIKQLEGRIAELEGVTGNG